MARAPAPLRDLGRSGAIVVAPHLVVARGPQGGLTLWHIAGDGVVRHYVLAVPVPVGETEGA